MSFSVTNMWSTLKTIGLVIVITVLIWLWAEAENLRRVTMTPRLQFPAVSGDLVVRVDDPDWRAESVTVRLEGPTAAIDDAERVLRSPVVITPGVPGFPAEPGEHTLRVADLLRQHPELSRIGITITDTQPATIDVRVARLVTRELPVRADLTGIEVEGDVTIRPSTVSVTMPEAAAAAIGERGTVGGGAGGAQAIAVISENDRRQLREDGAQTVTASIVLPEVLADFEPVTVTPEQVRVTLRTRKQQDEIVVPSVPVWITMPNTEGTGWDIRVHTPIIRNVTVRGPAAEIAKVRSRELLPIAFVVLSSDDLEEGVTSTIAFFAPVWASQIGADGQPRSGTARQPEAAVQEQVAPLFFSAADRRVSLEIRRRPQPADENGPLPGPVDPGPR